MQPADLRLYDLRCQAVQDMPVQQVYQEGILRVKGQETFHTFTIDPDLLLKEREKCDDIKLESRVQIGPAGEMFRDVRLSEDRNDKADRSGQIKELFILISPFIPCVATTFPI